MRTLVYYDAYQKEGFEKIKALDSNIFAITSEEMLLQKYVRLEVPILIVLSQPPLKLLKAISRFEWTQVLVHIGIRNTDIIKGTHIMFDNLMALESHYERCKQDQLDKIKKVYIDGLDLNDPLDLAYIDSLYPKGVSKRKVSKPAKRKVIMKSGIITFVGNPELVKMFSKAISKQIEGRVLVVDGDFLKPSMAEHFSVKKIQTAVESHLTGIDNTGLNIALDALSKGVPIEPFLEDVILKVNAHLHLLLGNYNLHNYEHYEMHQLIALLSELKKYYEIVVLSVSDNIYDQMTMVGVHQGQTVVFAPEKNSVAIRYIYQILPILKHKQGVSDKKMTVLSFEKRHFVFSLKRLSKTSIKALFPKHYIGSFTNQKRDMKRLIYKIQERMI